MRLSPVPPQRMAPPLIPQDVPVYRVTDEKGFFADDTLFLQDTIIAWPDEPNPNMEPMNDLAHDAMKKYLGKLDAFGNEWARREKKSYVSQLAAYVAKTEGDDQQDGRRAIVIGEKTQVPLLGGKKRGRPRATKVDLEAQGTQVQSVKGKFSLDRVSGKDAVNKVDGSL